MDTSPVPADDAELLSAYAVDAAATHVRVNFVTSADGAVSLGGLSGGLSSPADKRIFGVLRSLADVVLVGAGTVRAEGYGPVRSSADRQRWREAHGYAAVPPIAVVTAGGDLDARSRFFADAVTRPLVYSLTSAPADRLGALREVADVVAFDGAAVPVRDVVSDLAARGLRRILCEGGPRLFGELAAAGLVDELALTVSPTLAGPGPGRIVTGPPLGVPTALALRHVLTQDSFLFLRYTRG